MTAPFTGPDEVASAVAQSFWTRMGEPPDPGWRVFLGPPAHAGRDHLFIADSQGCPLDRSPTLAAALRRNIPVVDISLADGSGRLYATGSIGRRRSVARTLTAALTVAGPLAVIAAQGQQVEGEGSTASRTQMAFANAAAGGWFARRLVRAALTYREWACAQIEAPSVTTERLCLTSTWQTGQSGFWADPCVVAHEGRVWLFMEELDRRSGRGRIVAAEFEDGFLRNASTVLSNDHHLSFPQVTRHNNKWVATVETCASHNPVYEFDELGSPWRPCVEYPALPPHTADAVVDFHEGVLVGTDAMTEGDSVLVNYLLNEHTWVPVPAATRVDVAWSRGGGTVDRTRSIRAVQDCSGTYGVALGWTDRADPARHLARWRAADLDGSPTRWSGIHTMTWDPEQSSVWIDGWRRRFSPVGWRHRLIEQRHFRQCQG